jgi:diguanylate cyclase (GGDEF)-like protein
VGDKEKGGAAVKGGAPVKCMNSEQCGAAGFGHAIDADTFDLAPVSLWLEDYSALKQLFEKLRADGVTSLRDYLLEDRSRVKECCACLRVVKINQKTLAMFEADSASQLVENMDLILRDETLDACVSELSQLWEGQLSFASNTVNYSLLGRRMDIQLKGNVLPGYEETWERVLVAIEDVTERETARRQLGVSEAYARGLFEHSPVSLWVEDFSAIKTLLDEARLRGISDLRVFTDVHPEFVDRCMSEIRVIDVNRHTLLMFGAPDKPTLLRHLDQVFRDDMHENFRDQLIDLWNGTLFQQREVVNYSLDGSELHFQMQFSVLPGYESDWSLVQVALTDITARKKAEAYLEYLGRHDTLTKLNNRAFYTEELNRLERKGPLPVTIVFADLNGLKDANDQWGHDAGDALLRRAGEVLNDIVSKPHYAARIGGDEFAVLLPATDAREGEAVIESIQRLIEVNNTFYPGERLSMSIGYATSLPGERLEATARRADARMFEAKRLYYASLTPDRRGAAAVA